MSKLSIGERVRWTDMYEDTHEGVVTQDLSTQAVVACDDGHTRFVMDSDSYEVLPPGTGSTGPK